MGDMKNTGWEFLGKQHGAIIEFEWAVKINIRFKILKMDLAADLRIVAAPLAESHERVILR